MTTVAKHKRDVGEFGAKLRAFREAAGISQIKLAAAVGVGRMTYIRYENGDTEPPWSVVVLLADALGITPDAFLSK